MSILRLDQIPKSLSVDKRPIFLRQNTKSTSTSQHSMPEQAETLCSSKPNKSKHEESFPCNKHSEVLEGRLKDRHSRGANARYSRPKSWSRRVSPVYTSTGRSSRCERIKSSHRDSVLLDNAFYLDLPSPSKVSLLPHDFEIFPSVSLPKTSSKTTNRLFILSAIQSACDSMAGQLAPEKQLQRGLQAMRKIKKSVEWTSHTLNKIESNVEADMMAYHTDYLRQERDSHATDKSLVRKEFRSSTLDPSRTIAKIERSVRRSRVRVI